MSLRGPTTIRNAMLVAVADPSVPSYCPCQASGMGNRFDAGGKLKSGPGDAPPSALHSIGINPGATRSDKATHPSPGARGRAGLELRCTVTQPLEQGWRRLRRKQPGLGHPLLILM